MARADELYNVMYDFYIENNCWHECLTAKEWNETFGTSFSPATFTVLYNQGKLQRFQERSGKSYCYQLVLTGTLLQKQEEFKRTRDIENAKWRVECYEESVARIRATYEERIKQAEEQLARDLAWEAERLAEAKALLASN